MTSFRTACAVLLPALAALSSTANADPRFSSRAYVKNEIVTLDAKPGIESAIAFGAEEHIENIAVGNSAKWDVNPNKRANVVFVKPTAVRARTNMTVITDQHVYLFDLVSSGAGRPVYMMQFTYPDAPKPAAVEPKSAVTAVASASPTVVPKTAPVEFNFGWRAAGEKRLLPATYFDDGSSTFLHWPDAASLPAILVRGFDGTVGPVNYTVKGDTIIVEGVPAQLILRSGKQTATLTPMTRRPRTTETATAEPRARQSLAEGGAR